MRCSTPFAAGLVCLLAVPFGARAQSLMLTGTCPGPMTLDVSGATPGGNVALASANGPGVTLIPGGPCAGQPIDIAGNVKLRGMLVADGAGNAGLTANIPQAGCSAWVQAVDMATCNTTEALPITDPGAPQIQISCTAAGNTLRKNCAVQVSPPGGVEVLWRRTDGLGVERSEVSPAAVANHDVQVIFLAPDTEYQVVARPEGEAAPFSVDTFTTGSPAASIESFLDINSGASTLGLIGGEAPCTPGAVAVIYDTETGDLVWYEDLDPGGELGWLDMVRFTDDKTIIGETDGQVVEVDLYGTDITRFNVNYPGCCGLHHDIFKYQGHYISFFQDSVGGLTVDEIVILDDTGFEVASWNPRDHLIIPGGAGGDWLHTNSVFFDTDGHMLLSWLRRDTLAKIDMNPQSPGFGSPIWFFDGNPPDVLNGPETLTADWGQIGGANFFSDQHNFSVRHDGRYMVLDNANGRGLVFTVDEGAGTATVEESYDTFEAACGAQGTATDTQAGNAIVACATDDVVEYAGISGQQIWHADLECPNGGGAGWSPNSQSRWYALDGW